MEFLPYLLVLGLTQAVYGHFMHPVLLHPLARKFRIHPIFGVPRGPFIHPLMGRPIIGPVRPFLRGPIVPFRPPGPFPFRPVGMVPPFALHKAAIHMKEKRKFWENAEDALNRQRPETLTGQDFGGNLPAYANTESVPTRAMDQPTNLDFGGKLPVRAQTESVPTGATDQQGFGGSLSAYANAVSVPRRAVAIHIVLPTAPKGSSAKTARTQEHSGGKIFKKGGTGISQRQYENNFGKIPLIGGFPAGMQVEGTQSSNQAGITGGNTVVRKSVADKGLSSGLQSANNGGTISYEQFGSPIRKSENQKSQQLAQKQYSNDGKTVVTNGQQHYQGKQEIYLQHEAYNGKMSTMSAKPAQSASNQDKKTVMSQGYHRQQTTSAAYKPSTAAISQQGYQDTGYGDGQTSGQQQTYSGSASTGYKQPTQTSEVGHKGANLSGSKASGSQEIYGTSTSPMYENLSPGYQDANLVSNQISGQQQAPAASTLYEQQSIGLTNQGYQETYSSGSQSSGPQETYGAATPAVYDNPERVSSKQGYQESNQVNSRASGQQAMNSGRSQSNQQIAVRTDIGSASTHDPSRTAVNFVQNGNEEPLLTGNEQFGQNQGMYREYQSKTADTNGQQTYGTATSVGGYFSNSGTNMGTDLSKSNQGTSPGNTNTITKTSYSQETQDLSSAPGPAATYESQFNRVVTNVQTTYDPNGPQGIDPGYQTQVGYQDIRSTGTSGNPLQDQYMQGSHFTLDASGPAGQQQHVDTSGPQDPYFINEPVTGGNPNIQNPNDIYGTANSGPSQGKAMISHSTGTELTSHELAIGNIQPSNPNSYTDITYSKTSTTKQDMSTNSGFPHKTQQHEMVNDFSTAHLSPSDISGKAPYSGQSALTDSYKLSSPSHNSVTVEFAASSTQTAAKSLDSTPPSGMPPTTRDGLGVFEPLQTKSGPYSQEGYSSYADAAVPTVITDNTIPAGTSPQASSAGNVNSNNPSTISPPTQFNSNSNSNTHHSSPALDHGTFGFKSSTKSTANTYSTTGNSSKNKQTVTSSARHVTGNEMNVHSSSMSSSSTKGVQKSQTQLNSSVEGLSTSSQRQQGISVYTDVKTEAINPVQNTVETQQKAVFANDAAQQGISSSTHTDVTHNANTGHAQNAAQQGTNGSIYTDKILNANTGLAQDATQQAKSSSTYTDVTYNANTSTAKSAAQHGTSGSIYTDKILNANTGLAQDATQQAKSSSTYTDVTYNANTSTAKSAAQHGTSGSTYTDMTLNTNTGTAQDAVQHVTDGSTYNDVTHKANTGSAKDAAQKTTGGSTYTDLTHKANTGSAKDAAQKTTGGSTYTDLTHKANTGSAQDAAQNTTGDSTYTDVTHKAKTGPAPDAAQYTTGGSTYTDLTHKANSGPAPDAAQYTTGGSTYTDVTHKATTGSAQNAAQYGTGSSTYTDVTHKAKTGSAQDAAQNTTGGSTYTDVTHKANTGSAQDPAQNTTGGSTYTDVTHKAYTGPAQDPAQNTTGGSTYTDVTHKANTGPAQDTAQYTTGGSTYTDVTHKANTGSAQDAAQYTTGDSTYTDVTHKANTGPAPDAAQNTTGGSTYTDVTHKANTGPAPDAVQYTTGGSTYTDVTHKANTGPAQDAVQYGMGGSTYTDVTHKANTAPAQDAAQYTTGGSTYTDLTHKANTGSAQDAAQNTTGGSTYTDVTHKADIGSAQDPAENTTGGSTYTDVTHKANTGPPPDAAQYTAGGSTYTDVTHKANTGPAQDAAQYTTGGSTYTDVTHKANTGPAQDAAQYTTGGSTYTDLTHKANTGSAKDAAQNTTGGSTYTDVTHKAYIGSAQDPAENTTGGSTYTDVTHKANTGPAPNAAQNTTGGSTYTDATQAAADSPAQATKQSVVDTNIGLQAETAGTAQIYKDSAQSSAQVKRIHTVPFNTNINLEIPQSSGKALPANTNVVNTQTGTDASTTGHSLSSQSSATGAFDAPPIDKSIVTVHKQAMTHETLHNGYANTVQSQDTTVAHIADINKASQVQTVSSQSGRSFDMTKTPSACRTKECIKVTVSETKLRNYLNNKVTPTAIGTTRDLNTGSTGANATQNSNNDHMPGQTASTTSRGTMHNNINTEGHSASHQVQSTTSSTYGQESVASLLSSLSKTVFDMTSYIENKRFSPSTTYTTEAESRLKDTELAHIQQFMRDILNRVYDLQGAQQGPTTPGVSRSATVTVRNGAQAGMANSNQLLTTMEALYASIPALHSTDLDTLRYFRHLLERQVRNLGGSGRSSTTYTNVPYPGTTQTTQVASGASPTQTTHYTTIDNRVNIQQMLNTANLNEIMTFVRQGGQINADMVNVLETNSNFHNLDPSARALIMKVINGAGSTASSSSSSSASITTSSSSASASGAAGVTEQYPSTNVDGTASGYTDSQGSASTRTYVDVGPSTIYDPVVHGTSSTIDQTAYNTGNGQQTRPVQSGTPHDTQAGSGLRLDAASNAHQSNEQYSHTQAGGSTSLNDPHMNYVKLGTPVHDQAYGDVPYTSNDAQTTGFQSATSVTTVTTGTQAAQHRKGASPPEQYHRQYNNMITANTYGSQNNGQASQNIIMDAPSPATGEMVNSGSFADAYAAQLTLPYEPEYIGFDPSFSDIILSSPVPNGEKSQTLISKTTSTASKAV